jgi:hypothetical protein
MADQNPDDPIITVRLTKGLAERNRLPLGDVLSLLEELRQMFAVAGRRVQRARGMANPTGDFGLEVIAGDGASIFKKGSVEMPIVMTQNITAGLLAAQEVLSTLVALETEAGVPEPTRNLDQDLIRRISRIARVQRRDGTELEIRVEHRGSAAPITATFGSSGIETLKALQAPTFQVEGVSLFGKLVQLVDYAPEDDQEKGFWGELILSDGEVWRVQFKATDAQRVKPLFREQVHVTGKAVYYRVKTPKIVAESIVLDPDRDYEAAFDEIFGSYKNVFNADFDTLMRRNNEEE